MSVLVLGLVIGISRRLRRIEHWLVEQENRRQSEASEAPAPEKPVAGGAFDEFLKEDPARLRLSKSEQFSEYRKWRQEKGLNWSNS